LGPPHGICLAYANWAYRVPLKDPRARPLWYWHMPGICHYWHEALGGAGDWAPPYGICLAYANWAYRVPLKHPRARPLCGIGICQAYANHFYCLSQAPRGGGAIGPPLWHMPGICQLGIPCAPQGSARTPFVVLAYARHMPGIFTGGVRCGGGARVHTPLGMAYVGYMTGICQVIAVDVSTELTIPTTPMSALPAI